MKNSNYNSISLLTHVLDAKHLVVLQDWLEFVGREFDELVVIISDCSEIKMALEQLCHEYEATLRIAGTANPTTAEGWNEDAHLTKQFQTAKSDYVLLFKLDTLPYRQEYQDWLDETLAILIAKKAIFITGSTQPFLNDLPLDEDHYLTQRVSNNFLIIDPKRWLNLQDRYRECTRDRGRFASEARLEICCEETREFGIRRKNKANWRVFHTQLWDNRLISARQKFKNGYKVEDYMRGYQDNLGDPWRSYYLHPVPSLYERAFLRVKRMVKRSRRKVRLIFRK